MTSKFGKMKGLVTGLLSVALSFSALGAAQAATVLDSKTVGVNKTFTVSDSSGANIMDKCGTVGQDCIWTVTPEDEASQAAIEVVGLPVRDVFTLKANATGDFTVTVAGTRVKSDGEPIGSTYETTWSIKVLLGTVVDVAAGTDGFSTLVAAVTAAGLVDTLNGDGPFTVFAPTDAAFAKLDPVLVRALLLPQNKALLTKILTYHVVSGKVMSTDIVAGDVATLEGQNISLTTDGGVKVNGATVAPADVLATNGVIHVIDTVLLPPDLTQAAIDAFLTPTIKISITGYAYNAKGKSTRDDKRAAAVERFLKSFTSGPTVNAEYAVAGTVLKKASKKARSAVVTVTKTLADGTSTQGTTVIYFNSNGTSLSKASKAKLSAFFASLT